MIVGKNPAMDAAAQFAAKYITPTSPPMVSIWPMDIKQNHDEMAQAFIDLSIRERHDRLRMQLNAVLLTAILHLEASRDNYKWKGTHRRA